MSDDTTIKALVEQLTNDSASDVNGIKFEITRRGPGGTGDETTVKGSFYREDVEEFKDGARAHVDFVLGEFRRMASERHPLTEEEQ